MNKINNLDTPPLIQLGNPLLRLNSAEIQENEFDSEELNNLVSSLFSILKDKGGVGIAAPQIGINKRVFVFSMDKHPIYTEIPSIPYTVLINPKIINLTEEVEERYEGCFSVGTLRGKVNRCKKIVYTGLDINGNLIEREVDGLHARVVQHEYDHLDGILFIDKLSDPKSLGFHQELVAAGEVKIKKIKN